MRQTDFGRIAILVLSVLVLTGLGFGVVAGRQLRAPLPDAFADGEAPVLRVTVPLTPLPLLAESKAGGPPSDRVGALVYRGGLSFSMAHTARLGGLSALHVRPRSDGQLQVVGLSDTGDWLAMALPQPEQWAKAQHSTVLHLGLLQDTGGRPHLDKREGDAESLAVDPVSGTVFVGFEQTHRIQAYRAPAGLSGRADTLNLTNLPSMPRNRGFEALTVGRAASGDTVLLAGTEDGGLYVCPVAGGACRFRAKLLAAGARGGGFGGLGYSLTSLEALPPAEGQETRDLIALFRHFDPIQGFWGQIAHIRLNDDDRGESVKVTHLATLSPPYMRGNLEGLWVLPIEGGWRIFVASDNNFMPDVPTTLQAFDWMAPLEAH